MLLVMGSALTWMKLIQTSMHPIALAKKVMMGCAAQHTLFNVNIRKESENCRRARIAKNRELFCKYNIQRRKCFSIAYNFKSQSFSKAVYISKENALFDLDRYRYFRIDDDDDCTQIKITKENIYENNELISFINSVL